MLSLYEVKSGRFEEQIMRSSFRSVLISTFIERNNSSCFRQDRPHKTRELIFHLLQDNLSHDLISFGT